MTNAPQVKQDPGVAVRSDVRSWLHPMVLIVCAFRKQRKDIGSICGFMRDDIVICSRFKLVYSPLYQEGILSRYSCSFCHTATVTTFASKHSASGAWSQAMRK